MWLDGAEVRGILWKMSNLLAANVSSWEKLEIDQAKQPYKKL
jgi:hypothetical protein